MPVDEILRNSAPAIGGLLVAAAALASMRLARRTRARERKARLSVPNPAE